MQLLANFRGFFLQNLTEFTQVNLYHSKEQSLENKLAKIQSDRRLLEEIILLAVR